MKRRPPKGAGEAPPSVPGEPAAPWCAPAALRLVRMRRGLFLALPPAGDAPLVPYRLELLSQAPPPFLLPVHRRARPGADAVLLDASGLLPLTRRFPNGGRPGPLRRFFAPTPALRLDRAEAEAVLAGVDAALQSADELLLPASCIDLSPGSVFLRYREAKTGNGIPVGTGAPACAPTPDAPAGPSRPFDVLLACVPCRLPDGALGGRDGLVRWFEARGLLPGASRRTHAVVAPEVLDVPAVPPAAARSARRPIRAALPWIVLAAEALAVGAGLWLAAQGIRLMPFLLSALAVADAVLLLLPASPLSLRGAPELPPAGTPPAEAGSPAVPGRHASARPSDRTERLSTAGQVTKLGILSEHEPGTFEETEGRRWFVLVDEFTVGRDPGQADLVPDAPGVSRLHARIRRLGDAFTVEDLSARNGTFLDDRRLDPGEERVLPDRCTLRFAAAKYWFRVE